MTKTQITKWIGGFSAGIGVVVWIYSIFLTKEAHVESLKRIEGDIAEIKLNIRDIRNALFPIRASLPRGIDNRDFDKE